MQKVLVLGAIIKILFWIFLTFLALAFSAAGIYGIYETLEFITPFFLLLLSILVLVGIIRKASWGIVAVVLSGILDSIAFVIQASRAWDVYRGTDWLLTALVIIFNIAFLWIAYMILPNTGKS